MRTCRPPRVQYRAVTTLDAPAGPQRAADAASTQPVYLDCNATTPIDPRVADEVMHYLTVDYGNAGSRTHTYGQTAKDRVQHARRQVAVLADAQPDEVIFTSGATESNNLALLGLAPEGQRTNRRHIISTAIEHKAVLEPLEALSSQGFDVTLLKPTKGGWVGAEQVTAALRPDTLLVSVMHVNNETGVIQPIEQIADALAGHPAYFHVDAAQGYGKLLTPLRHPRIDLTSISGHKIYGPKGIGALIARRRRFSRPPLTPLVHGGGQERGLRAGTLPVALIAGLGAAAQLAHREHTTREHACAQFKQRLLDALAPLSPAVNGEPSRTIASTINISIPTRAGDSYADSEAVMLALKDTVAISNGSACTSQSYDPSHVLTAMGLSADRVQGALRFSWSYLSTEPDWHQLQQSIAQIL
ncbi:MAG: cysteine desulfurase DndA [Mycobacterium sp.]|nr:cysteine desulfurase DndA [Mycobacterium sp.]